MPMFHFISPHGIREGGATIQPNNDPNRIIFSFQSGISYHLPTGALTNPFLTELNSRFRHASTGAWENPPHGLN